MDKRGFEYDKSNFKRPSEGCSKIVTFVIPEISIWQEKCHYSYLNVYLELHILLIISKSLTIDSTKRIVHLTVV